MARILTVADAVKDALNGGTWTPTFTAIRAYVPEYLQKDFGTIKVTVIPNADESEILTRSSTQDDVSVDVAVQKKLTLPPVNQYDADPTETDPLLLLLEAIKDFFLGKALAGVNAVCTKARFVPIYAPDHMRQDRIFTGVVTLTFRVLP